MDIFCAWQWFVLCWFCWCAVRAVFPLVVARPEMLCIMAGMDQKDRFTRRDVLRSSSACCSGMCLPRDAGSLLSWLAGPDARHHGRYVPEGLLCGEVLDVPVEWSCRLSGAVV